MLTVIWRTPGQMHPCGTRVPKPSLPVRLALLVAGTTLPLIIFAAGIVYNDYEQDRGDASQRVLETVRSIRLVLDAEVLRMTGGLQVLALTSALAGTFSDPFGAYHFGHVQLYYVFANMVAVPLTAMWVMPAGLIALLANAGTSAAGFVSDCVVAHDAATASASRCRRFIGRAP